MERIIITTGGTGGHIFPALAVAEEIRHRYPGAMILFLGGRYGPEADLAVKAGLDFTGLPVRGVLGRGIKGIGAGFSMVRAVFQAGRIMRKFKPQLVIGFGGYAAFAGVSAASLSGITTAIQEQNAYPGMTNRILGKWVKKIFLAMPDSSGAFPPEKVTLTGNPVRAKIADLYEQKRRLFEQALQNDGTVGCYGGVDAPSPFPDSAPSPTPVAQEHDTTEERAPRLLVMGGSLGAKAINDGMIAAMPALLEAGIDIRHQTGKSDYERIRTAYQAMNAEKLRVEAFIADMPKAYAWADLVFCRAGASTLAEITAAGLPAVLVPFPQAAQDHQRHNAGFLLGEGAAQVLEQKEFLANPDLLARTLVTLLRDKQQLAHMAARSLALAKPYAASAMVDGLEALLGHGQNGSHPGAMAGPHPVPRQSHHRADDWIES